MGARVILPSEINEETIDGLLEQLAANEDAPDVSLNFSQIGFVYPHASLVAASAITAWRDQRKANGMRTRYEFQGVQDGTRGRAGDYLAHIGFFRYIGIPVGNEPGEARGSSTYLPFTRLSQESLSVDASETSLHEAISRESYRLALLVSKPEETRELLAYCFREAIRNVFEHALTDSCALVAQKYLGTLVEIAVVDLGRGIQASLSDALPGITPEDALRLAVLPGISRSVDDEGRGRWENTGFGLYVLSQLGNNGGEFSLWSGRSRLTMDGVTRITHAGNFRGTAVRVRVETKDADMFPNQLAAIVSRGEASMPPEAVNKLGESKSRRGGWV